MAYNTMRGMTTAITCNQASATKPGLLLILLTLLINEGLGG